MIKVFEMFAGYGGASFSLKKAEIEFETVGYSEIDKYAIQCYEQNHKGKNFGDCTKINPKDIPDFDLLTGGFPCPTFSAAGKGLGEEDPRGKLFEEIIRIAEVKQPKYMLLENVKGLTFKSHKKTFDKIISELNRIGYHVFWKVLNSKNYGVPQNRARVFFVCFKQAKLMKNQIEVKFFKFPEEEELKIFLKDILEDEVDSKYYLSEKALRRLDTTWEKRRICKEISPTLMARDYKDPKIVRLNDPIHSNNRVYSVDGISPTLNTMRGGNRQPKILTVDNNGEKVKNVPEIGQANRIYSKEGITPTLNIGWTPKVYDKNIRKLTPKECFRLMGFLDDKINLEGLSDTRKYELAGNGWEIGLVSKILKEMIKNDKKW